METEANKAPSDRLELGNRTYKMTYGMLSDLQRVVPNAEQVVLHITSDHFVRDYIIRRVLTDIKGNIKSEEDLIDSEQIELSIDEIANLLEWATGHLLHFFVRQTQGLQRQGQRLQAQAAPSPQPASGSET